MAGPGKHWGMARSYSLGSLTPGVNNRRELSRLAAGEGARFLAGARNVDLTADGLLSRRAGQTLAIAGGVHSLWAPPDGSYGMAVINGSLARLTPSNSGLVAATVRAEMGPGRVSYSEGDDGALYWTNGDVLRRVIGGQDRPAITPGPSVVPAVSLIPGSLPAGRYTYAFTATGPDGESASTTPQQIELTGAVGLRFQTPTGVDLNLYLSSQNGDVLEWMLEGQGNLDVTVLAPGGRRLRTAFTAPMPAGSIVRHFNGRMLVADGSVLYMSMPYSYGLYEPARGYLPLPGEITLVEPTDAGLYIAADRTYWLANLTDAELIEVLPFGALAGSSAPSPSGKQLVWQSPRGLVLGDAQGQVKLLQDDALAFGGATTGATLWRETDGMRQAIATRFDDGPPAGASASNIRAAQRREGKTYA